MRINVMIDKNLLAKIYIRFYDESLKNKIFTYDANKNLLLRSYMKNILILWYNYIEKVARDKIVKISDNNGIIQNDKRYYTKLHSMIKVDDSMRALNFQCCDNKNQLKISGFIDYFTL